MIGVDYSLSNFGLARSLIALKVQPSHLKLTESQGLLTYWLHSVTDRAIDLGLFTLPL